MNILDGEEDILDTTLEGFSHISDIGSKAVSKLVNPLSTLFSSSKEEGATCHDRQMYQTYNRRVEGSSNLS